MKSGTVDDQTGNSREKLKDRPKTEIPSIQEFVQELSDYNPSILNTFFHRSSLIYRQVNI